MIFSLINATDTFDKNLGAYPLSADPAQTQTWRAVPLP